MWSHVPSPAFVLIVFRPSTTSKVVVSAAPRSTFIDIVFCRRRVSMTREHDVIKMTSRDVRIFFAERLRLRRLSFVLSSSTSFDQRILLGDQYIVPQPKSWRTSLPRSLRLLRLWLLLRRHFKHGYCFAGVKLDEISPNPRIRHILTDIPLTCWILDQWILCSNTDIESAGRENKTLYYLWYFNKIRCKYNFI